MNHTLAMIHFAVEDGALEQTDTSAFLDDGPHEPACRQLGVQHR
jgi:hypothetical protein